MNTTKSLLHQYTVATWKTSEEESWKDPVCDIPAEFTSTSTGGQSLNSIRISSFIAGDVTSHDIVSTCCWEKDELKSRAKKDRANVN